MSEKIVITVEQDKAIGDFKKLNQNLYDFAHYKQSYGSKLSPLKYLTIDQMARILYEPNSYEVEKPKFEVGDIVIGIETGRAYRITSVGRNILYTERMIGSKKSSVAIDLVRHATKEEIFWAELGRDYRETKIGDCISLNGEYLKVQENMGCERYKNHISHLFAKGILINGHSDGFYPATSFIKLP